MSEILAQDKTVATTILKQLGGNRFACMVGASRFSCTENSLTFFIPRSNGIRKVSITLRSDDTYDMAFYAVHGIDVTLRAMHGADCTQLQSVFTATTGLDTSL